MGAGLFRSNREESRMESEVGLMTSHSERTHYMTDRYVARLEQDKLAHLANKVDSCMMQVDINNVTARAN